MADDTTNTPPSSDSGTPSAGGAGNVSGPAATPPKAGAMAEAALQAAQDAVSGLAGGLGIEDPTRKTAGSASGATPMTLPSLTANLTPAQQKAIDLLADVNLDVKIELGRTRMLVEDVLKLGEGAVVELDKLAGDPVDIYVNNRHVARGEVLVLNDSFCVRVSEILQQVSDPATMVAKPA
jgi:flagellar motor switch protein FliN